MSQLAADYAAFDNTPAEEPPGHLTIEPGCLALACGDLSQSSLAAEAAASFRKDHLTAIAEPIAKALPTFAPDYLSEAGAALLHRLKPAPRPSYLISAPPTREEAVEDLPCGTTAGDSTLIPLVRPAPPADAGRWDGPLNPVLKRASAGRLPVAASFRSPQRGRSLARAHGPAPPCPSSRAGSATQTV